jgi:hypothetical protein
VDRATVQFEAFNLNGLEGGNVDGDREEPETYAQPPQHSLVAHPQAARIIWLPSIVLLL